MRELIATNCRNTPSATNSEDKEIVDAPGNGGNASMPEQVTLPNPWREMMMMMIYIILKLYYNVCKDDDVNNLTASAFCCVGSNIYKHL